ncbi:MAG: hypothetical protein IPK26_17965 [Planctomycetes bacterium]|nr:hypothetical protein [Planctomycetota bacterium]
MIFASATQVEFSLRAHKSTRELTLGSHADFEEDMVVEIFEMPSECVRQVRVGTKAFFG